MRIDKFITIAIVLITTGIVLGALGAHSLKNIISQNQLYSFNTGVKYQLFHGIALLVLALNPKRFSKHLKIILFLMTTGILLFSFSIYLLSIQNILEISFSAILGPITPIGGAILISAWIYLLFNIKKQD